MDDGGEVRDGVGEVGGWCGRGRWMVAAKSMDDGAEIGRPRHRGPGIVAPISGDDGSEVGDGGADIGERRKRHWAMMAARSGTAALTSAIVGGRGSAIP
jgi:hypothetical protein